jgi:hypothetical protein
MVGVITHAPTCTPVGFVVRQTCRAARPSTRRPHDRTRIADKPASAANASALVQTTYRK